MGYHYVPSRTAKIQSTGCWRDWEPQESHLSLVTTRDGTATWEGGWAVSHKTKRSLNPWIQQSHPLAFTQRS